MTQESFLAVAIGAMIALFFGTLLVFGGYRFFLFLLPIWGFFFGFGLGAESVQALFGDAFLATVTSWVVGFVVAMIFAVCAYLFYFAAVALIAGSLGYALGVGIIEAIFGSNFNLIAWIVGIVLAVIFAIVVLVFNIQKWVIIAATAILGAGVIITTFVTLFGGPSAQVTQNPVRVALQASPWWTISFLILAILGIAAQFQSTRSFELDMYNRSSELIGQDPDAVKGQVSA